MKKRKITNCPYCKSKVVIFSGIWGSFYRCTNKKCDFKENIRYIPPSEYKKTNEEK